MPTIYSPQSQAGITNFYDALRKGPKIDPKVIVIFAIVIAIAIIIFNALVFHNAA
ncbi:MAG: hypothetical protein ARM1_0773 [Candidatus Micrarchaeota archaeon]|nr:MAG: hypothetical protein ARM1_0773 [Candidatus Micrarchaeota archaeon]